MAEINQSVYGAKENWYVPGEHSEFGATQPADVYYYNQIAADDKLKIKVANFNTLETPITTMRSQMDGQYTSESYLIRNNWKPTEFTMDNSIIQFGIGPQSGLSRQEWWYVDRTHGASNPDTNTPPVLKNTDTYDITNMCLATRSNYTPYEFYSFGQGSILGGYDNNFMYWQVIDGQTFGTENSFFDADYSNQWGYKIGYVNTKLITQIPIKNLKLTPVIYAYNSTLDNYKKFTSISDYLTEKSSYPYIFCIKAKFMYRSGQDDAIKYDYTFDCYPWFFNPSSFLSGYGYSFNNQNQIYGDVYYPNRGDHETGEGITVAGRPGYAHGPNGSMLGNEIYWYGHQDSSSKWDFTIGQGGRVLQTPDFKFVLGTKNLFYCDTSSMTNDQITEGIRTQLASFGMFFVDGVADLNLALDDDKTFLGILENGVGYGKYSNGKKNREQDQWNWDTMDENKYDPQNPPDEPETDPSGTPILPSDPGFTTAGKGTACYAMTYLDIDEMMGDIFGSTTAKYNELVEGLAMFGSNPMNAFVSCKWYPFVFSSPRNSPVILGSTIVNNNHQYNVIDGVDVSFKKFTGSVKIKADKNFIWSRRTKARLFLPFYGFYELPMNMLMSYTCQVEFHYNVPDEMATWIISFGDVIYDFVECDPSIEVPLTGDNAREVMLTKRQIAAHNAVKNLAVITLLATAGVQSAIAGEIASTVGATAVNAGGSVGSAIFQGVKAGLVGLLPYANTAAATVAGAAVADNKITSLSRTLGNLSVNVPTHGGSGATTFLNFPLEPYIQLYQPAVLSDYNESEYKLKVGIACDKWCKISEMPENSLLKTTGIADNSTSGMEISEIKELNAILQSGFYR